MYTICSFTMELMHQKSKAPSLQSGDVYYGATLKYGYVEGQAHRLYLCRLEHGRGVHNPFGREPQCLPTKASDFHPLRQVGYHDLFPPIRLGDGKVPLRDWLLENGGKLLTAEYDETGIMCISTPMTTVFLIDVTVGYDQVFTLPTGIPRR